MWDTMRLSKLKIAGFKSFVDPTTIDLRSNLTGIVGPNGCGKSNTIDAVRWVMGESSAKHLRGASMDDVIFNGSSSRKPIGQASVELLFDNSDGSLGGEYAKFSEIGIKRQISRDGQSKYLLNGTRCRRRDITDIFLGTGLGPRSYAIIEQGMISRLIEAKPEELRNTLEEAAGISKYKDRRRETETRIRHTRENLDRLSDLREELEKQLAHLNRQAKAAERFKTYKKTERRISAELILLRLKEAQEDILIRQNNINEKATKHQAQLAEQRSLENKIESLRTEHSEANDNFNTVQASFYQVGAEISRIEQTIKHQQQLEERYKRELEQVENEINAASNHAKEDQNLLKNALTQLEVLEPTLAEQRANLEQHLADLSNAEEMLSNWQQSWESLQQRLSEPAQQAQVERARMEQLENSLQHISSRLLKLQTDKGVFNTDSHESELEAQQKKLEQVKTNHQEAKQAFETCKQSAQSDIDENRQLQQNIQETRSSLQALNGKLSSLEVLQKAALNKDKGSQSGKMRQRWLIDHKLGDAPLLAKSIKVEAGWEKAIETVLGDQLESVQLDSSKQLQALMQNAPDVTASFFIDSESSESTSKYSLAKKVIQPKSLRNLLVNTYCAETIEDALKKQDSLKTGESIITKEGILLGSNWLTLQAKNKANQGEGILARQKEIDSTQAQIESLKETLNKLEITQESLQENHKKHEDEKSQLQAKLNTLHREESHAQSVIHATENRIKQTKSNQQRILQEIVELETRQISEQDSHQSATLLRNKALSLLETLEKDKESLEGKDEPLRQAVNQYKQQCGEYREQAQQTQLQVETFKTTRKNTQQQLIRFDERLLQLEKRKNNLIEQNTQESSVSINELSQQLELQLENRKKVDTELAESRNTLQTIDNKVRELEQKKHQAEQEVEKYRNLLEKLKLEWQEVSVREQTFKEQFAETDFNIEELKKEMDEFISLKSHQQALEDIQRKVSRLGAINLAAIDEFKTQSERKSYLDQQDADLTEALKTLETAIAKIDKDTRSLFKDTFEKVNTRIQDMFPQLFGGGKAHLEMTGDDLLTTGITIMAQPPGKRISSIHLMSGGEKALTAVAMVFAIFELNPAPFCMLDEVDAPLDEANIGRFCNLVRKMSDRVQFIFITHSKTTMELADNLIGVTMREPGVSRLVSVDVNEANRMAQE